VFGSERRILRHGLDYIGRLPIAPWRRLSILWGDEADQRRSAEAVTFFSSSNQLTTTLIWVGASP
jgi:hypothetical protein